MFGWVRLLHAADGHDTGHTHACLLSTNDWNMLAWRTAGEARTAQTTPLRGAVGPIASSEK
jgi:hypothetical protein